MFQEGLQGGYRGITAYPVFGTIKSDGTLIPHGWVAMRVDDSTYYIDPTYVCQTGEMDNLKMKNEMERIGDRQYQLEIHLSIRQGVYKQIEFLNVWFILINKMNLF